MKLLAALSDKYAVFSVSHYDYLRADDGTMADGGQPGLQNYAGYTRASNKMGWIELPGVNFAELYNDYNESLHKPRKYGIHKLSEVRILSPEECPDTDSFEWKRENYLWGTNGVKGDKPTTYVRLVDCNTAHLNNILNNCHHIGEKTIKIIQSILEERE